MPDPICSRRGHIRIACFAGVTVFAVSAQVMAPGLSSIGEEFQLDPAQRGLLYALQYMGFFLTSACGGWLSDHCGRKRFFVAGSCLLTLGLASAPIAPEYLTFGLSVFCIGAGGGFVEVMISVLLADLYPYSKGKVLNQSQVFYNIGAIGMSFVVGWILGMRVGWRPGYFLGAAMALGLTVWVSLLRIPPTHAPKTNGGQAEAAPRGWVVGVLALVMLLYVGAELTTNGWAANYLEDTFGAGKGKAAYSLSAFWLAMMMGRLVYVRIVERWSYLVPVFFSAVTGSVCGVVLAVAPRPWIAYGAVAGIGLSLAGMWPTILAYAGTLSASRSGRVFSIIVSCGSLGPVIFPPLCGLIAKHSSYGLRAGMMLVPILLALVAVIVALLWRRDHTDRRRRQTPDNAAAG